MSGAVLADADASLESAICTVRPLRSYGLPASDDGWGQVVLAGLLAVTDMTPSRLAESAGCDVGLVSAIESGQVRPTWETLERLANAVGLEVRVGVRPSTDTTAVSERFDDDTDRVREALADHNAWRAGLGLGPLAPPSETVPKWDGTDPAPARQVSAWPQRTDFGGHTAINVRYGRNCVQRVDEATFAAAVGLTPAELRDIEHGRLSLSLDDTESLLNRAGLEQFAHLELYDDHDDLLHLDAIAEQQRHHSSLEHAGSR